MKFILFSFLLFLSCNVFCHEFIWGERLEKYIEKNGSPEIFEDQKNDGKLICLTYNYPTYKRECYFANKQLVGIMENIPLIKK